MNTPTPVTYPSERILEEVNKVSSRFIFSEVFFAHFFSGMLKNITTSIDTLAVSYQNNAVILYINPQFWSEHLSSIEYKYGGIKHEILHIVLKHIFRYKDFSHKEIFNVAADLVVNQMIERAQLIDGAVFLEKFPELSLAPNESTNYYYNKLLALYKEQSALDQKSGSENGKGSKKDHKNEAWENLKRFISPEHQIQRKHTLWRNMEDLSNAEREIAEQAIHHHIQNALQRTKTEQFGKLPAGLQQYLRDFEQSLIPKVNWRRILKIFSTTSRRSFLKDTLKRPSKRYGITPGIKIKRRNRLLIAIDTSGSIVEEELHEFFQEIYHIWRQGAEILVVECDAAIQKSYAYKGLPPKQVKGGGGTDFNPPIQFANEKFHPDAIIYFTDGYCDAPKIKSRSPLLWLLTKQGTQEESLAAFQGRVVKMN